MKVPGKIVCVVMAEARHLDGAIDLEEPDFGSRAVEEAYRQVEKELGGDPRFGALQKAVGNLDWHQQCALIALIWIGRGNFFPDEWEEAFDMAREEKIEHTGRYLLCTPHLADFLEQGLGAMGLACEEMELVRR